jgi:hypothetical protein
VVAPGGVQGGMAGNIKHLVCIACGVKHRKRLWGTPMAVKSYGGVLHIGYKRLLAPQGTLPGLVRAPQVGVCGYVCNAAYMVSRLVLWEVVQS